MLYSPGAPSADPTLFRNPHSTIAEVCLAYANSRYVSNSSLNPSAMPHKDSSFYWDDYQDAGVGGVRALAFRFLDSFDGHSGIYSAQLLILRYKLSKIAFLTSYLTGGEYLGDPQDSAGSHTPG